MVLEGALKFNQNKHAFKQFLKFTSVKGLKELSNLYFAKGLQILAI